MGFVRSAVGVFAVCVLGHAACITYPPAPDHASVYLVCVPDGAPPNVDLVVFAHGFVAPTEPVQIPEDQLQIQGVSIPALVNSLGFAFAATSYPKNGLAILEGVDDMRRLVAFYKSKSYSPGHVYLVGASEGGLVAAKSIEAGGSTYSGALALCGPIGSFRGQIDHFDDFRVVFDYFYPKLLPPSPVAIQPSTIANWDAYAAAIGGAVAANPTDARQVFRATLTPEDDTQLAETAVGLLWYNVFATNDAKQELHGQPFDNRFRFYFGTDQDLRLNFQVERFRADNSALEEMRRHYETTGKLGLPLVTMHDTGDPIVPYWHEILYGAKVLGTGSLGQYLHLPIARYGHCNFEPAEVLVGFGLLVGKVTGQLPLNAESALGSAEQRQRYRGLVESHASGLKAQ